jgi:hypothetical protein
MRAKIRRKLSDNAALLFERGVPIIKDYPVYNLKTQVRLNVTWLAARRMIRVGLQFPAKPVSPAKSRDRADL